MNYIKALETAIIYIEDHLDEEITMQDIAGHTGYSYYHLTRQFSAVLGEGIGNYIKKRRLADAAKSLIYSNKRIIDIAMDSGFSSSEAFSRAFKSAYSLSPYQYRKNRLDLFIASKDVLKADALEHRVNNITVHPKIVELPDIKAAGIRGETTLADNVLPQLWHRFHILLPQIPNQILGGRGFGICEACLEGNQLTNMNQEVLFTEIAAVEVDSFDSLKEPFASKTLRGGKYAVFTHKGSLQKLSDTFRYIWGTWFLSTKEELDEREDFELYDDRFLGYDHPDSEIDIYIPIK